MMMTEEQLVKIYAERAEYFEMRSGKCRRQLFLLSFLRLLTFVGGIVLSVAGFSSGTFCGIVALLLVAVLFALLLRYYSDCSDRKDHLDKLAEINRSEIRSVEGDWSGFSDGADRANAFHDFSNDIDLFGKDSLFQYVNRTVTGYGKEVLAGWLADPYPIAGKVRKRQEAVRELSGKLEWRQDFLAGGKGKSLEKEDILGLLKWLKEDSFRFDSLIRTTVIIVMPAVTVAALALLISGTLHYSVFVSLFLLNLVLTLSGLNQTNRIHSLLSKKHGFLQSVWRLLSSFENESFTSEILSAIKSKLTGDGDSATSRIRKLSGIIRSFDSRLNIFVGFVLNGILLWDFHCIRALEKWKRGSVDLVRGWLESLGEIEAYCSLANFAHNNPWYAWPSVSAQETVLKAISMGHPLIAGKKRICNDFLISGKGRIIIITGANMAGKSTFLRTVAVNMVLAMAGAPVCAAGMEFKPVRLFTSMRTTDSLSHNESYFYAELKRLKLLRDKMMSGSDVLFILDEILKGTNSADKSTGSKLFLKKIIEFEGTGLIATHDTSLGELEREYPDIISNKCFEIEIDGDSISFDYRLRDGITTRMNAALLMKEMGITDQDWDKQ